MKVLFLGYAVRKDLATQLSGASVAGNKMQVNILHYLKECVDDLKVITVYPVAVFPHENSIYVREQIIEIEEELCALRVRFLNLPIVKQISQILFTYFAAKKYIKMNPGSIILISNMYPQVGVPAVWLKRKYGCKIVPVLADLPIDDNYHRKGFGKYLRRFFDDQTKKSILQADKVIVLNKHARDVFAPHKEYLVIDGGIEQSEFVQNPVGIKRKNRNIVYSGSLSEYSGIKELVDAMPLVDNKTIKLDIYGAGTLMKYVQAREGANIHYYGKISNKDMLDRQREAWLLVNPRPVDDPIAKVTFPSKIFEYLMSGTPVLATKLNGFTEEYFDKLFLAPNNSSQMLAEWINKIDQMDDDLLEQMATRSREFVKKDKNWKKQVGKIVRFLEEM